MGKGSRQQKQDRKRQEFNTEGTESTEKDKQGLVLDFVDGEHLLWRLCG
jgi:hypothetical protein